MIFGFKYFAGKCILKNHSRFYLKMCAVACVVGPRDPVDRDRAARYRAETDHAAMYGEGVILPPTLSFELVVMCNVILS